MGKTTMQKTVVQLGLVLLCSCSLLIFGCADAKRSAGKSRATAPAAAKQKEDIAYLPFSLPEQVKWVRNPDEALANAGSAEWTLEGYSPAESPARVMYQKIVPAQAPATLKGQILAPLADCTDSQVEAFKGQSKYSDQINIEAICSQLGKDSYGLLSYISIFSDQVANHLVLAEIRTPASKKAGVLTFQNTEAQKQAETSKILSDLLFNLMQTIRVCDEKNLCI